VSSLSGLVAALLAAVAPATTARPSVAPALRVLAPAHVWVLRRAPSGADRRTRTCNARGSQRRSNGVERKLAPVACEQPPRSKVILTFQGGLFGSGH
jgi:hypothetical protein